MEKGLVSKYNSKTRIFPLPWQNKEQTKSIRQIESDIVDVNKIFKDLAMMVQTQGEVVEAIESKVEAATTQVTEAAQDVTKTLTYQVSKNLFILNGCITWAWP